MSVHNLNITVYSMCVFMYNVVDKGVNKTLVVIHALSHCQYKQYLPL